QPPPRPSAQRCATPGCIAREPRSGSARAPPRRTPGAEPRSDRDVWRSPLHNLLRFAQLDRLGRYRELASAGGGLIGAWVVHVLAGMPRRSTRYPGGVGEDEASTSRV